MDGSRSDGSALCGVSSFETGLAVLGAFDLRSPRLSLASVAERCGITRFAARRYLATLVKLGYVDSDRKEYFLTHRVLRLGAVFLSSSELVYRAQPLLHRLTGEVGENAYLWVRDGDEAQVVAKATANKITNRSHAVGAHFPLFVSSGGLSIVAALPADRTGALLQRYRPDRIAPTSSDQRAAIEARIAATRARGYALSEGQLDSLVRGIAVPLYGLRNEVVGAISVNMFTAGESSEDAVRRVLGSLRRAADSVYA
jgi:IclR family pca regulon transcriptional regulator